MSRHQINEGRNDREVFVGWDQPLLTFFVQVYEPNEEGAEEGPTVWEGTSPRELYDFEQLDPVLRSNRITISTLMRYDLYTDRDEGR